MKCDNKSLLLYAVTDRAWLQGRELSEVVKEALDGGITMLQLREKDCDYEFFKKEAEIISKLCKEAKVPFIINDDVMVAKHCECDGIHIGQDDMNAKAVREILGDEKIIGVSVSTVEQAEIAYAQGADYLGVGAMFSTATKTDANLVSMATLKAICEAVPIPVCVIGGINKSNIKLFKNTEIDGFAVVSAVFAAEDIKSECISLKQIMSEVV